MQKHRQGKASEGTTEVGEGTTEAGEGTTEAGEGTTEAEEGTTEAPRHPRRYTALQPAALIELRMSASA